MAETLIVASQEWISAAGETLGPDPVLAILQGYPYSGFGLVAGADIQLPRNEVFNDPSLYWDLRLFSAKGEWHAWKVGPRWYERRFFANESGLSTEQTLLKPIHRDYILWGGDTPEPIGDWTRFIETRGAEVWVPGRHTTPLKLRMKLLVDYDPKSHLAGIVDAVICGIERR